jgi:hypothetical protein
MNENKSYKHKDISNNVNLLKMMIDLPIVIITTKNYI